MVFKPWTHRRFKALFGRFILLGAMLLFLVAAVAFAIGSVRLGGLFLAVAGAAGAFATIWWVKKSNRTGNITSQMDKLSQSLEAEWSLDREAALTAVASRNAIRGDLAALMDQISVELESEFKQDRQRSLADTAMRNNMQEDVRQILRILGHAQPA